MPDRIVGITRTSLWKSWKAIRRQLRKTSLRDIVDFLEYDIDPDVWINRLLTQIANGTYEPNSPRRFTIAKSKGFSRQMTLPGIPDLVLYRATVDYLYTRVRSRQHKHVYFERIQLHKIRKEASSSDSENTEPLSSDYEVYTVNTFQGWLEYDQYRKFLIFRKIYPYIVVTDITNFFDSVLYNRIVDSLHQVSANRRVIGMLFFILERLSVREAYTESPRIGLPVDEFDCSRKLAHMVLFPHDDRMVAYVGEDAYVRWMDDQNIGVSSRAQALKALSETSKSLARLHLTPNAAKSKVLSLPEARRHFHLDINRMLDKAEKMPHRTRRERLLLGHEVKLVLKKVLAHEGEGEWEKVLKRVYRIAGLSRTRSLRAYCIAHVLQNPTLIRRIADYVRCSGTANEFLTFAQEVIQHEEQIYPDVNLVLVESLLRLEPSGTRSKTIRQIGSSLLSGKLKIVGWEECASVAPLLLLRYGDRRTLPSLRVCFERKIDTLPAQVIRASAVVYASFGISEFHNIRKAAGRLLRNNLAEMVRMVEKILSYKDLPDRIKPRIALYYDAVAGTKYVDMRALLSARLLGLNRRSEIRLWLAAKKQTLIAEPISQYDRCLLERLM
jgi:hypothetical protein